MLRPYQQDAFDKAVQWMKKSVEPAVIEAATGAGKSHIVAAIAAWIYESTGKHVLCVQPSKELTEQNHEKYLQTGNSASIYSASAGSKCLRWPVVYATPGTVKNRLSRFGGQYGCIIIDEAHGITETIKMIVDHMRKENKRIRVIGLTATPYRMNTGYIYQYDENGRFVPEDQAKDPYFNTLLYRITTRELVDMGFLTPAHADPEKADGYEAKGLQLNKRGQFDSKDIERVFEGRGRLTSQIIADVVAHSAGRRGVMIFAATVNHAKECMESLDPDTSMMIGGDVNMGKADREKLITDFKKQRFKYLVSVGTLTTGFDAPHVDVIAVLRPTESPSLLQQIIGRGLRLYHGKEDCLVLDYAENIERHNLHDDLFRPEIKVKGSTGGGGVILASCPWCNFENEFSARPNPDEYPVSKDGYFLDLDSNPIVTDQGEMPAHFGRRCTGQVPAGQGLFERCGYRWTCKECPECGHENDIAARFCESCKEELVDPNEKLKREFIRVKKDPYTQSTDPVLSWDLRKSMSKTGNETLRVDFVTEYRTFTVWFTPTADNTHAVADWQRLSAAVFKGHIAPDIDTFLRFMDRGQMPQTITYAKRKNSDFFKIYAYNRPADEITS